MTTNTTTITTATTTSTITTTTAATTTTSENVTLNHFSIGFHDTASEEFNPVDPNFKRLRQQQLDGELRREKEAVSCDTFQ